MNSERVSPESAFIQRLNIAPIAPGLLDGLTFAAKDIIDIAGVVTGCGNPTWAATHRPAVAHAVPVQLLLGAGARCLGKTVTDEFAFSLVGENHFYGTPVNPRAPERIPGGSSSGSASAVAGGLVDFALGTDTAGSVRVPAANCGILGLRSTWGRWSMAGIQPLAPSYDTLGLFAREPKVLRSVARCLSGGAFPGEEIRRLFVLEEAWKLADPAVRAGFETLKPKLSAAGFSLETTTLKTFASGPLADDIFFWKQTFSAAQWPEVWSTYGAWLEAAKPELGPKIAANFDLVRRSDRVQVSVGLAHREAARRELRAFLRPGMALCLPTTPCPPPLRGQVDYDRTGHGYLPRTLCLTAFAGLAGLPQISLPFSTADDLPVGLSLVGAPETEEALVAASEKLGPL